jgi:hypothetical protein
VIVPAAAAIPAMIAASIMPLTQPVTASAVLHTPCAIMSNCWEIFLSGFTRSSTADAVAVKWA